MATMRRARDERRRGAGTAFSLCVIVPTVCALQSRARRDHLAPSLPDCRSEGHTARRGKRPDSFRTKREAGELPAIRSSEGRPLRERRRRAVPTLHPGELHLRARQADAGGTLVLWRAGQPSHPGAAWAGYDSGVKGDGTLTDSPEGGPQMEIRRAIHLLYMVIQVTRRHQPRRVGTERSTGHRAATQADTASTVAAAQLSMSVTPAR